MPKYRNKSVVIEAVQFNPRQQPWPDGVKPWPNSSGMQPRDMSWGYIQTRQGTMHVQFGDWIITDMEGERSLCKDDIFKETYELVE